MSAFYTYGKDGKPDTDPTDEGNQRDINTQLALSIALGLAAFLTFCVSSPLVHCFCYHQLTYTLGSSTSMEDPLRSTEKAKDFGLKFARAAGQLLRMDTRLISYIRG